MFKAICRAAGLPEPMPEFMFCERKWRFDWAWPTERIALEVEGGAWTGGRHTRGKGFLGDIEKYNRAQLDGWMVLRVIPGRLVTHGVDLVIAARRERAKAAA